METWVSLQGGPYAISKRGLSTSFISDGASCAEGPAPCPDPGWALALKRPRLQQRRRRRVSISRPFPPGLGPCRPPRGWARWH